MITQAEIKRRISAYLNSEEGQRRVAEAGEKKVKVALDDILSKLDSMLREFLPVQLQDGIGIEHGPIKKQGKKTYKVDVMLTNVWRPSLDPDSYPSGAENIVVLFNSGYDTSGRRVRGEWAGHGSGEIWSLPHRDGEHFMEDFVNGFNFLYGKDGVQIKLASDYTK